MVQNGIFNVLGQIIKLGSTVLVMPLLIRFLGISQFGYLSWTTAILAAVQLAEGGLSSGLLYFLSEHSSPDKEEQKTNEILSSGIILLVISTFLVLFILLVLTPFLTSTLNNISIAQKIEIQYALHLGAFLIGIRIIQGFFWAILQSRQLYKIYSLASTLQIILGNISWAVLAFFGDKYLPDYIIINLIISIIFSGCLLYFISTLIPTFNWNLQAATTRRMFKYNLGVLGGHVGSILFSQGDKLIVANTLGISTLGVYTIFTNIVSQINQFAAQAVHPIMPLVSSIPLTNDKNYELSPNLTTSVKKFFLVNVYISLGGAGILIILAEPILQFFLGSNFSKLYLIPFQTLSLIYGVYTLSVTGYYITLSLGKSVKVMAISILSSLATLVSMYFSAKLFGLIGLILSNSFFMLILLLLFQGMKKVGIKVKTWKNLLLFPLILAIILMLIAFINPFTIPFQILISLIFSGLMIFSFAKKYNRLTNKLGGSIISMFKLK